MAMYGKRTSVEISLGASSSRNGDHIRVPPIACRFQGGVFWLCTRSELCAKVERYQILPMFHTHIGRVKRVLHLIEPPFECV